MLQINFIKKDYGLKLSLREKRQLYGSLSQHEENIYLKVVVEDILKLIECKNIDKGKRLYKNTLRKTASLTVSNQIKQDLFGVSHVAYIQFLSCIKK